MPRYAELIYNGFWFSPEREMLQALIDKSQEHVTGHRPAEALQGLRPHRRPLVRPLALFRGACDLRGRRRRRLRPEGRAGLHPAERAAAEAARGAEPAGPTILAKAGEGNRRSVRFLGRSPSHPAYPLTPERSHAAGTRASASPARPAAARPPPGYPRPARRPPAASPGPAPPPSRWSAGLTTCTPSDRISPGTRRETRVAPRPCTSRPAAMTRPSWTASIPVSSGA
jgi:hypothetical protein